MSRVITFSRTFPSYHPKAGQPTYFVEKVVKSLHWDAKYPPVPLQAPFDSDIYINVAPKHHTIRAGHRFKVGDKFSPRVWSGKPYGSKMIQFAPDIEVKKVWCFEFDVNGVSLIALPGEQLKYLDDGVEETIAKNDGLEYNDFLEWVIMPYYRKGKELGPLQIICWNETINY
jgi:hypothetical protein